jgi:NAD(P)-dependent dehydrogenase (short-subunit alcohol dehydrogenase family)
MPQILVTGANRGLGLEFCRQYAVTGWQVLACCRQPEHARELMGLADQFSMLSIIKLDVSDFDEIDYLAAQLMDEKIDILINNAGVYGDSRDHAFGKLNYQDWTQALAINVQAPVKMAEAFFKQINRSDKKLLVSLSSQMGSIADNSSGGCLLYRSSKAGLNAAMKSLAIDLQASGIGVMIFHPGWVKTDMGGVHALIDTQQSVSGMREQMMQFTLDQTGCFIKYEGSLLPW